MADNRRIELSGREIIYLKNTGFLPAELAQIIQASLTSGGGKHVVILSRDVAEQFREEFTHQLAKVGFDPDYKPTGEGKVLEGLIDRFYGEA